MFGNNRGLEKRLRKGSGKTAQAQVIDAKKTHWVSTSGDGPGASSKVTWILTLRVMPDGEPPFDVTVKEAFHVGSRPITSRPIAVLYDPQDHKKVVVTHSQPMSDAERAEELRSLQERARQAKLQQQGQASSMTSPSTGFAPTDRSQINVADELEKLASLRDRGVLTEFEFETQKRKVLGM